MPNINWKKEIFTIPNILSLVRIVLIPVYIAIYFKGQYYLAAGILAVSCLTDLIDGKIARHFNMISTLGKILDPVADKATQFSLIICLMFKHSVLLSLVVLFVIKEGFQLIAGGINLRRGIMLKGALISGKVCTTILFVSLIFMVMIPNLPPIVIHSITAIDMVAMLISLAHYLFTYFKDEEQFQPLPNSNDV